MSEAVWKQSLYKRRLYVICGARLRTDLLDNRSLAMLLEISKGLIYQTLVSGQPLTRAGRKMTDGHLATRVISKLLQFRLPQTTTCAVPPPTLSGEPQCLGVGIRDTAHPAPPLPERRHRQWRRLMA